MDSQQRQVQMDWRPPEGDVSLEEEPPTRGSLGGQCAERVRRGCDNDLGGDANEPRHSNCEADGAHWQSWSKRRENQQQQQKQVNQSQQQQQQQQQVSTVRSLEWRHRLPAGGRRSSKSSSNGRKRLKDSPEKTASLREAPLPPEVESAGTGKGSSGEVRVGLVRERCGSNTSDYFTSSPSHNSPVVLVRNTSSTSTTTSVAHLKSPGQVEGSQVFGWQRNQQSAATTLAQQQQQRPVRATIYENPTFARDAYEAGAESEAALAATKRMKPTTKDNNADDADERKLSNCEEEQHNCSPTDTAAAAALQTSVSANSNYRQPSTNLLLHSNQQPSTTTKSSLTSDSSSSASSSTSSSSSSIAASRSSLWASQLAMRQQPLRQQDDLALQSADWRPTLDSSRNHLLSVESNADHAANLFQTQPLALLNNNTTTTATTHQLTSASGALDKLKSQSRRTNQRRLPTTCESSEQQQQQQNHYYYYNTANHNKQLNSQASSQRGTNDTTCDESAAMNSSADYYQPPSHLDSDYHYYQVVVPHPAPPQPPPQQQQQQQQASLVCTEPLIRSSSWQNRTLVNLRQVPHLDHSSLARRTLLAQSGNAQYAAHVPGHFELSSQKQQQPPPPLPPEEHLYCGLGTLRTAQRAHCKGATPLHLAEAHLSPAQLDLFQRSLALAAGSRAQQVEYLRRRQSGASSSDSALGKFGSSGGRKQRWLRRPRLCFLLFLLSTAFCLALLALLSSRPPTLPLPDLPQRGLAHKDADQQLQRTNLVVQLQTVARQQQPASWAPAPPTVDRDLIPPLVSRAPSDGLAANRPLAFPPALPPATPTTFAPPTEAPPAPASPSTESYWRQSVVSLEEGGGGSSRQCGQAEAECSLRGLCDRGRCFCLAGFSGPTCASVECPNECSGRGDCRLRQDRPLNLLGGSSASSSDSSSLASLESLSFQTLGEQSLPDWQCPNSLEAAERNQSWAIRATSGHDASFAAAATTTTYDNRLAWQCVCRPGFTGADCAQVTEVQCDDERDNDADGLVDCEDDDCCSQVACRDSVMCVKSPEPSAVLAARRSGTLNTGQIDHKHLFFEQQRFLVANKSVQSYMQEKYIDRERAAVVRGQVIKATWPPGKPTAKSTTSTSTTTDLLSAADQSVAQEEEEDEFKAGLVGVRVSVIESAQFAPSFSLTRQDGYFDLLVNGSEWITLKFMRNAHVSVQRKIFVKANAINVLREEVQMWPISSKAASNANNAPLNNHLAQLRPFDLQLGAELFRLASSATKRDDERRRKLLLECLRANLHDGAAFRSPYEPLLIEPPPPASVRTPSQQRQQQEQQQQPLRSLYPIGLAAHKSVLSGHGDGRKLAIQYNSAYFSAAASVVKPTVSLRLLPDKLIGLDKQWILRAILVQIDVEGQARRERLAPLPKLTYQFGWNRRDVYGHKVYGFGELTLRIGYEYQQQQQSHRPHNNSTFDCIDVFKSQQQQSFAQDRAAQVVWFERTLYLEAHQLNQHADIGRWNLIEANRVDLSRGLIYLGAGWTLPYKLIYPPVVSEPIYLAATPSAEHLVVEHKHRPTETEPQSPGSFDQPLARLITRGPNSSIFLVLHAHQSQRISSASRLVQLDSSGKRRILDVPLSILAAKLGLTLPTHSVEQQPQLQQLDDLQLLYNNYLSTLYLSSRLAAKMVQVSYSSLLVLNRTLAGSSATASADDEIDIEPLIGFGRQPLTHLDPVRSARQVRLIGPHSLALDEDRQLLYFVDGPTTLMALDLNSDYLTMLSFSPNRYGSSVKSAEGGRGCRRSDLRFRFADFKPHRIHNLLWSRADSSLYFLDQNVLFALRPDLTLEVVAMGASQSRVSNALLQSLPTSCFRGQRKLGFIKALAVDESNQDLLITHQWPSTAISSGGIDADEADVDADEVKVAHRLYLAVVKLHFRSIGAANLDKPPDVIDLHSAQTWDSMILRAAELSGLELASSAAPNWTELARLPTTTTTGYDGRPSAQSMKTSSKKRIPFIHSSGGFGRIDSLEINSEGSIFVLDLSANSIRLISAYSLNDFNLVDRRDVNINRLFAPNNEGADLVDKYADDHLDSETGSSRTEALPMTTTTTDDDNLTSEQRKLRVLIVPNPISNDLMEFHSASGLQLSLTTTNGLKSDFYYQSFSGSSSSPTSKLDEDDEMDFSVRKLIASLQQRDPTNIASESYSDKTAMSQVHSFNQQYLRLSRITDSLGNHYELIRLYTGTRFALHSILNNQQPLYEVSTDSNGVMTSLQQTAKDYWIELKYDNLTYLLRDTLTRTDSTSSKSSFSTTSQHQQLSAVNNLNKDWRQLKRAAYDRIFYHYCDMFIVNA